MYKYISIYTHTYTHRYTHISSYIRILLNSSSPSPSPSPSPSHSHSPPSPSSSSPPLSFVEFWIFLYLKCSLLSLKWLLVFIVFPYFPRNTKTQGSGWVVKIYKPPLRNKDEYSIMNILTHMAPTSHVQPVNK